MKSIMWSYSLTFWGVAKLSFGDSSGLGWLAFWVFHCLPNSAWADGNLGRSCWAPGQDSGTPKSKSTQPTSPQADGTACTCNLVMIRTSVSKNSRTWMSRRHSCWQIFWRGPRSPTCRRHPRGRKSRASRSSAWTSSSSGAHPPPPPLRHHSLAAPSG